MSQVWISAAGLSLATIIGAMLGFNSAETSDAWAVTLGIALQNIPEGMVVIAPLLIAGVSKLRTFVISLIIALLEVVGVWMGYGIALIKLNESGDTHCKRYGRHYG